MRLRGSWFRSLIQLSLLYFFALSYFFTVHLCGNNRKRLDAALKTYIVMAVILSAYGVYQGFAAHFGLPFSDINNALRTSGQGYGGLFQNMELNRYRSQATFGEPAGFGQYLLSVLPLLLTFGIVTKGYMDLNRRKWIPEPILIVLIGLTCISLFMTRARGPLVGFILSVITIPILLRRQEHIVRYMGYIGAAVLAISVFYIAVTSLLGVSRDILNVLRLRPMAALEAEDTAAYMKAIGGDRYQAFFQRTPELFAKHPFLGVGIGNSSLHFAAIYEKKSLIGVAGLWAGLLVETGIVGFASFSLLVFVYYRTMLQTLMRVKGTHWSPYIIGYLASFTGMLFTLQVTGDIKLGLPVWFYMGISMATVRVIETQG